MTKRRNFFRKGEPLTFVFLAHGRASTSMQYIYQASATIPDVHRINLINHDEEVPFVPANLEAVEVALQCWNPILIIGRSEISTPRIESLYDCHEGQAYTAAACVKEGARCCVITDSLKLLRDTPYLQPYVYGEMKFYRKLVQMLVVYGDDGRKAGQIIHSSTRTPRIDPFDELFPSLQQEHVKYVDCTWDKIVNVAEGFRIARYIHEADWSRVPYTTNAEVMMETYPLSPDTKIVECNNTNRA